jgi:hypothetical protein
MIKSLNVLKRSVAESCSYTVTFLLILVSCHAYKYTSRPICLQACNSIYSNNNKYNNNESRARVVSIYAYILDGKGGSNIGSETGYPDRFFVVSSVLPGK